MAFILPHMATLAGPALSQTSLGRYTGLLQLTSQSVFRSILGIAELNGVSIPQRLMSCKHCDHPGPQIGFQWRFLGLDPALDSRPKRLQFLGSRFLDPRI